MSDQSRRNILKAIAAGGAVVSGTNLPNSWHAPIVNCVMLPAHAQTSCGIIRATSPLVANEATSRQILIADESDNVLALCCCGDSLDIVIETPCLPAGIYRVFGDSDNSPGEPLNHTVHITTAAGTFTVHAPTYNDDCRLLIATVILPQGTVQQESGQLVGGPKCGDNINCLQGGTSGGKGP